MSWSLKLITVRGIPIRVHVSFLLILAWAAYNGFRSSGGDWLRGAGLMVLFVLLLFICVVLHELGHSLVAQLFGVQVQDITLYPVGGLARIVKLPQHPFQEFLITAAGPATNILLAIALSGVALAWTGPREALNLLAGQLMTGSLVMGLDGPSLLLLLAANNIMLALFNLIPAFPMDGGRLLRSFLASWLSFSRATRIASIIGQVAAGLMAAVALLTGNFLLGLIAILIFSAAGAERQQVLSDDLLGRVRVHQVQQPVGLALGPDTPLAAAGRQLATSSQSTIVVWDEGRLAGVLARGEVLAALRKLGPTATLAQAIKQPPLTLAADATLAEAQHQLGAGRAAVVMRDDQIVGTLSTADLLRAADALSAYREVLAEG